MRRFFITAFVFLSCVSFSFAQAKPEELEAKLKSVSQQKQAALLNDIAEGYLTRDQAKAREFASKALERARQEKKQNEELRAIINLGEADLNDGKQEDSLQAAEYIVVMARKIGDKVLLARALNLAGKVYRAVGDVEEAIASNTEAAKLYEEVNDKRGVAEALMNLGLAYQRGDEYEKAEEPLMQSAAFWEQSGDKNALAVAQENLGVIYLALGEPEKSLDYLQRAINNAINARNKTVLKNCFADIAETFAVLKNFEMAYEAYRKHVKLKDEIAREETERRIEALERRFEEQQKEKEAQLKNHRTSIKKPKTNQKSKIKSQIFNKILFRFSNASKIILSEDFA